MRDLLVTAIVLGALPFAFRRPWIGIILWTWLSIMNPHRLTWGFAYDAPFAAMAAGATLFGLFFTKDKVQLPRSPAMYMLVAFILWMGLTTIFALDFSGSLGQLNTVFKIQLMTLVALAVLHEKRHILAFVWINALSLGFFGFKGGLYTIATAGGGRVWGPGGFIGGNNEIGLAILVAIPLLYYLYLLAPQRWVRFALMASMLLSAVAVLGTQSRGALLAIMAMGLVLWWRAPRKLFTGVVIGVAATLVLAVMAEQIIRKVESIQTYQDDTSAMGRIHAWRTAINVANARPLGAGFAMYTTPVFSRYAPQERFEGKVADKAYEARAAHSIFFQVLGEHGWVGLMLFLGIWVLTWRGANRLRRQSGRDPELQWVGLLAGMCQVALVGYAVGGAFLSLAYFDLPYNLMIIVVVTERWLAGHMAQRRHAAANQPLPAVPAASAQLAVLGERP
jgi:putative inorganic carbon (HCO3(-)) transporter